MSALKARTRHTPNLLTNQFYNDDVHTVQHTNKHCFPLD